MEPDPVLICNRKLLNPHFGYFNNTEVHNFKCFVHFSFLVSNLISGIGLL